MVDSPHKPLLILKFRPAEPPHFAGFFLLLCFRYQPFRASQTSDPPRPEKRFSCAVPSRSGAGLTLHCQYRIPLTPQRDRRKIGAANQRENLLHWPPLINLSEAVGCETVGTCAGKGVVRTAGTARAAGVACCGRNESGSRGMLIFAAALIFV